MPDSGATCSTISKDFYRGEIVEAEPSMGINGILTKTFKTPLSLSTRSGADCNLQHCFRIIPGCPVSLLGRDLLGKLGITMKITAKGGLYVKSDKVHLFTSLSHPEEEDVKLSEEGVWAVNPLDVGFISCTPYKATFKPGALPVYHKQYPISREKEEGIEPIVEDFLKKGILREIISPYNTPINPVKKPDGSYRFVQDLRAINNLVVPIAPIVPDVPSLLTSIPSDAEYFSVIDLSNAFFSIPVDEETQPLFAFRFKNRTLTWCKLLDSPVVYSIVLQTTLRAWTPEHGSVLLQYADDLLLCSLTREATLEDGRNLLKCLFESGHKVSKKKLQWCQDTVEYLGFVLSKGERKVSHKRAAAIVGLPAPLLRKACSPFLV